MKCSVFRERMYLRDEEINPDELKELQQHRSSCAACAADFRGYQTAQKVITALRNAPPEMKDPLLMRNLIMSRLEERARVQKQHETQSAYDSLVELLRTSMASAVIVSLLILITTSFAIEYISGFVEIEGLESTVAAASSQRTHSSAAMTSPADAVDAITDVSRFLAGKRSFVGVSGDWIMINRNSFEALIVLYDDLQSNASKLSPEFRSAHPGIARLLATKRDPARLDSLLKEREPLIRELNDLIPKGRKTP